MHNQFPDLEIPKSSFSHTQQKDKTNLTEPQLTEPEFVHPSTLAILEEIETQREYYHACGKW